MHTLLFLLLATDLTVGFNREDTMVSEDVGSFELCVMIFIPELSILRGAFEIANPFSLSLLSANGSAGKPHRACCSHFVVKKVTTFCCTCQTSVLVIT